MSREPNNETNPSPTTDPPPVILKADGPLGLFIHYDEAGAGEFRDCLTADEIPFSFNPPEAANLAQPGKAVFVFGRRHPRVVAGWLKLCGEEVVIDPDVVITEDLYLPPVKQLLSLGEPQRHVVLDYAGLGLSLNDVPALIRMATDYQLHNGPQDSPIVWAPVHAWRALAQLRAEEAIAPLVELFRRADEDIDDWINADLPEALARFGAPVLAPVTDFLANPAHGEWARVAAADAIGCVGKTNPELRADCVARLTVQLEKFAEQSETFNAFLISPLWDLRAVEAMPVIERAFASGRVDESVLGDVEDVQIEFGLKTKREHPPRPNSLTRLGDEFRAGLAAEELEQELDVLNPGETINVPYIAPLKVGRNDPCPCGSGKKYKKCCGK